MASWQFWDSGCVGSALVFEGQQKYFEISKEKLQKQVGIAWQYWCTLAEHQIVLQLLSPAALAWLITLITTLRVFLKTIALANIILLSKQQNCREVGSEIWLKHHGKYSWAKFKIPPDRRLRFALKDDVRTEKFFYWICSFTEEGAGAHKNCAILPSRIGKHGVGWENMMPY